MVKRMYYAIIAILAIICIVGILFASGSISMNEQAELNGVSFELPPGFSVDKDNSTNKSLKVENVSGSGSEYFYLNVGGKGLNISNSSTITEKTEINGVEVNITRTTWRSSSWRTSSYATPSTIYYTFRVTAYEFMKDNKPFYVSFSRDIDNETEMLSYLLK